MAETGDQELQSRPPEPRTAPWLVFFHGRSKRSKKNVLQTFYSVSEGTFYIKSIHEMKKCRSWPTPQGWMLMEEPSHAEWYLLNPATMERINLPMLDWDLPYHAKCTLSSIPSDPNCMIMCADSQENLLFFCGIKDNEWIRLDAGENTPSTSLACSGNFYSFTISNRRAITPGPSIRILEELDFDEQPHVGLFAYDYFLVESCGEMFYVKAFSHRAYLGKRIHFDVWKRDSSLRTWSIVDGIGDRVFFLGTDRTGASYSATELGVKGNCIYYILRNDKCLYVFDMEEGSISVQVPCPHVSSKRSRAFWIVPSD